MMTTARRPRPGLYGDGRHAEAARRRSDDDEDRRGSRSRGRDDDDDDRGSRGQPRRNNGIRRAFRGGGAGGRRAGGLRLRSRNTTTTVEADRVRAGAPTRTAMRLVRRSTPPCAGCPARLGKSALNQQSRRPASRRAVNAGQETRWSFTTGATGLVAREVALLRLLGRKRRHASLQMLLDRRSARRLTAQIDGDHTQTNQAIDQEISDVHA